jgi:sulfonate transport system permease protein
MMRALGLLGLLLAWQAAASVSAPHVLPGPLMVAGTLFDQRGALLVDAGRSFARVGAGYLAAVALGLAVAGAMRASRPIDLVMAPLLAGLRAVPPLAWAPMLLLWIGIGDGSAAIVVFLGAFFPVARMARAGLGAVPDQLRIAASNLGATPASIVWRVLLPAALPDVVTGLRLGWTLAWMSVVAAELVGADGGLGQRVLDARNLARPDIALASMVVIGTLAAVSEAAWGRVERRILRWRP